MSELNTTGYALLGLLNQHPWSAYELTQFMRVSYLRAVWPRAESRLYEAPKKLVKLGYATAGKEASGKRSRTIYSITDDGRTALQAWLKTSGKDVIFEHEALLQLANCDAGEIDDLHAIIERIKQSTEADLREMAIGLELLLEPDQRTSSDKKYLINTLVNTFIAETLHARLRWLDFAENFTRDWDSLEADEAKIAASEEHYQYLLGELNTILASRG